jgi:hypothetical protein
MWFATHLVDQSTAGSASRLTLPSSSPEILQRIVSQLQRGAPPQRSVFDTLAENNNHRNRLVRISRATRTDKGSALWFSITFSLAILSLDENGDWFFGGLVENASVGVYSLILLTVSNILAADQIYCNSRKIAGRGLPTTRGLLSVRIRYRTGKFSDLAADFLRDNFFILPVISTSPTSFD